MATVTVTVATSLDNPRANYRGGVTSKAFASGNVTYGGAGDVLMLARIPNQARIVGILGDVQCAATSVQGVLALCRVDTSGTLSNMATLASLSAVTAGGAIATGRFQPTKLSLSDDAAVQYAVLAAIASGGTQSTSFSINGVVLYETGGGDS